MFIAFWLWVVGLCTMWSIVGAPPEWAQAMLVIWGVICMCLY